MSEHIIENIEDIKKFILSGKAIFTIEGNSSRFTYKITKKETKNNTIYFVSVLTGCDNLNAYTYLGTIFTNGFRSTQNSTISKTAPSFIAFNYFYKHLERNFKHENMNFYHHGRCGRCGKTLTVPESIISGLGPSCVNK